MTIAEPLPRIDELGGYVTVQRAAELLGIKRQAVNWALRHGNLEGKMLGDKTALVSKRSLERYSPRRRRG